MPTLGTHYFLKALALIYSSLLLIKAIILEAGACEQDSEKNYLTANFANLR